MTIEGTMTASAPRWPRFRIPGPLRPLFLKWITRNSNLVRFAENEMQRAGLFDKDSDYGGMLGDAVLQMIRQFSDEGHSGFSAGIAVNIFQKVARFEPLTPLTGEPDEWMEAYEGCFQNRRCSHVFKDKDGQAYDGQGRVFREPSGACFTSFDSRVYITFPYTPRTEYVDVPAGDEK